MHRRMHTRACTARTHTMLPHAQEAGRVLGPWWQGDEVLRGADSAGDQERLTREHDSMQ